MMKNLHARSTPTRDHETESLSEAIRQGQREAIAEALSVGRAVPSAPPHRSADGPSALDCGSPLPLSISSHVVPASAGAPHSRPKIQASRLRCIAWFVILGIIFALGISNFAFGSPLPSCLSVEDSALRVPHSAFPSRPPVEPSAFSLGSALAPLAFLAEVPAPSPSALGSWLISAVAALSILALGKQFIRKTPLEAQFLTKREFQDFKDKDFADLRNRINHSHESLSNKLDGINNRLHDVGSLVARLDERTKVHKVHSPSTESTNP
jgi:hypothetical protein